MVESKSGTNVTSVVGESAPLVPSVAAEEWSVEASGRRLRTGLTGLTLIVMGIATMWLVLSVVTQLHPALRTMLVLAGIAIVYRGLDRGLQGLAGRQVETTVWLCAAWMVLLVTAAVFADLLPLMEHKNLLAAVDTQANQPPDLFSRHPLGTSSVGLDLLARSIYGARVSLLIATVTVSTILVAGGLIGLVAGYYRGRIDQGIGILTDTFLAVPPLVLLIAFAAVLGRPVTVPEAVVKMSFGLAVVGLPSMVRLARANTLTFAQREFVLAAKGMGASHPRIVLREVMPNVAVPMLAFALIIAALFVLAEGSLSFLGLGLRQPEPTWGNMIAEGQGASTLRRAPFIALVPGAFMFFTIYSLNRIGEHFRGAR